MLYTFYFCFIHISAVFYISKLKSISDCFNTFQANFEYKDLVITISKFLDHVCPTGIWPHQVPSISSCSLSLQFQSPCKWCLIASDFTIWVWVFLVVFFPPASLIPHSLKATLFSSQHITSPSHSFTFYMCYIISLVHIPNFPVMSDFPISILFMEPKIFLRTLFCKLNYMYYSC